MGKGKFLIRNICMAFDVYLVNNKTRFLKPSNVNGYKPILVAHG